MMNDWAKGDLLKVTVAHYFAKGDTDATWPEVFQRNDSGLIVSAEPIPEGAIVMAIDSCPFPGARALIRVMHEDGIWVANSNRVQRIWPAQ